jgi:hypothetical protein
MRNDDFQTILNGADPADDEDILLRVALAAALRDRGRDRRTFGTTHCAPPRASFIRARCRHLRP